MEIVSFARIGFRGETVKVEVDLRRGIPSIDIVGLPDGAVREARERMRAAIRNSSIEFPRERILINLSPADLRKEGSSFDLSIALAVVAQAEGMLGSGGKSVMVLGELELSGGIRPIPGILAAACHAAETGIREIIVPSENAAEARVAQGVLVIGVSTLTEAFHALCSLATQASSASRSFLTEGEGSALSGTDDEANAPSDFPSFAGGFEDIRAQGRLLRALEIAAAGGHNLLAYGPPGCGKTLALRRFPTLLPRLDRDTAITLTRIMGSAGILGGKEGVMAIPPFREPHPAASVEGMTGGGLKLRPGEISLAHGGALFLDEAAQFKTSVLQSLRAPLETGFVSVNRAGRTARYPARFQLLVSMNPCACGNYGSSSRACVCAPESIDRYWKRLASPLLDRIDLRIRVDLPDVNGFIAPGERRVTEAMRERIARARKAQWGRNRDAEGVWKERGWLNAHLEAGEAERLCAPCAEAREEFAKDVAEHALSGRGAHGILKVARTIADLAGSGEMTGEHVREAASFRKREDGDPIAL